MLVFLFGFLAISIFILFLDDRTVRPLLTIFKTTTAIVHPSSGPSAATTVFYNSSSSSSNRQTTPESPLSTTHDTSATTPFSDDITNIQILYLLCPACHQTSPKPGLSFSCADRIDRYLKQDFSNATHIREMQRVVSAEFERCQSACHPQHNCPLQPIPHIDPDTAAPPIQYAVTPNIDSIPTQYRIPDQRNITPSGMTLKQMAEQHVSNFTATHRYLLPVFNPSVILAPRSLQTQLPAAAYLASFRASPVSGCVPGYNFWDYRNNQTDFLVLAVLDTHLRILTEAVLDVNRHSHYRQVFEDYRLVVLEDTLMLSHSRFLLPIQVRIQQTADVDRQSNNETGATAMSEIPLRFSRPDNKPKLVVYQHSIIELAYIRKGKNFHYFQDVNGTYFMEYLPAAPRMVYRMPLIRDAATGTFLSHIRIKPGQVTGERKPPHSFSTPADSSDYSWSTGRGSACCVRLERRYYRHLLSKEDPTATAALSHDYLLFGIMHHKLKDEGPMRYTSRFYAFEPELPFHMVATTGAFCLGTTEEATDDPFAALTKEPNDQLELSGRRYNCPNIHYVSGMSEAHNDSSKVVVGYGVNDCSSRFVVIKKSDIAERLFQPFHKYVEPYKQALLSLREPSSSTTKNEKQSNVDNSEPTVKGEVQNAVISTNNNLKIKHTLNRSEVVKHTMLCEECRTARPSPRFSCAARVEYRLRADYSNETLIRETQEIVSGEYEVCHPVCLPDRCKMEEYVEVNIDQAAPPIQYAVTPNIKSIPKHFRPPYKTTRAKMADYVRNFTSTNRYLLPTFNPSIIHAPKPIRDQLEGATYLASFRASPQSGCVEGYEFWNYRHINLLVLAVLDSDLQIMTDVVLDVNKDRFNTYRFEDYRLFMINGSIMLSHSRFLLPIIVTVDLGDGKERNNETEIPLAFPHPEGKPKLIAKYADGASILHIVNLEGKNFHYFQDVNGTYYIENAPGPPHQVLLMPEIQQPNGKFLRQLRVSDKSYEAKSIPTASFSNPKSVSTIRWTGGRGSACCVRLDKSIYQDMISPHRKSALEHDYLLFGVQHHRTFKRNYTYISRFYAFEPVLPFDTVAQTGLFCLGVTEEPSDDLFVPLAKEMEWDFRNLDINCPRIHYVSGMAEVSDDPSRVIVSYGISDCVSRFVVIEKKDIARLLFRPFSET